MDHIQRRPRVARICITVLATLLALLLLGGSVFVLVDRIHYHAFYKQATVEFSIPGLADGLIPQGLEYFPEQDAWVSCGYILDNVSPSRFYITTDEYPDGYYVKMKDEAGNAYAMHTGGFSFFEDYVYVPGTTDCAVFSAADIFDGDQHASVIAYLPLPFDPAYCTVRDGVLYAGTFHYSKGDTKPGKYLLQTPAGDRNYGIMVSYVLDPESGMIDDSTQPTVYSTPEKCQSAVWIDDTTLAFSTSWGLQESHILIYDVSKASAGAYTLDSQELPMYYLDSACLLHDIAAPAMAEQIAVKGDRIFISNEAASKRYLFGLLLGSQKAYSYPVPKKEAN